MKIKLIFFAQLRDLFGAEREMEITNNATIEEVISSVFNEPHAEGARGLPLRFAVNECFEQENKRLKDGDVLALMTPVAGG